jgi:hypothetical protein
MTRGQNSTFIGVAVAASLWAGVGSLPALAADDDARQLLKAMSDYLDGQKTVSASFDASLEAVTPNMEKIQFNDSGTLLLSGPNKVHATRTGGYADVELFFDGKVATVLGKNINKYIQLEAPGSIDQLIDTLRDRGAPLPGADLLLSNVYNTVVGDVIDAKHIGEGVVGGAECQHLFFRQKDVDWQLWVKSGPTPVPCKLVITSKAVGGAPEYTLVIRDWKTGVPADDAAFGFNAPSGSQKAGQEALANLDQLPSGAQ